jgi:hypothetical protein
MRPKQGCNQFRLTGARFKQGFITMRIAAFSLLLASAAAPAALAQPFTVVVLPDTQVYSFITATNPARPKYFEIQTQWIADNAAARNIKFVSHVGDIVDNVTAGQVAAAETALDILDGRVPYAVLPGNHDYNAVGRKQPGDLSTYQAAFGPARFADKLWDGGKNITATNYFGGYMPDDFGGVVSDINVGNSWQVFQGGGRMFLHLSLEWQPNYSGIGAVLTNRKVLEWAESIIDQFPGMPTIVSTHEDLRDADPGSANGGSTLFGTYIFNNLVRQNDQIFMVLAGHNHFGPPGIVNGNGEWRLTSTNDFGNDVFRLTADFQDWPDGGSGYLRLMTFDTVRGQIAVDTYSPATGIFLTDFIGPTASKFTLDLDFVERFGPVPAPASAVLFGLCLPLIAAARRRARG